MLATYQNVFSAVDESVGVTLKTSATKYVMGDVVALSTGGLYEKIALTGSLTQRVGVVIDEEVDATLADKRATIATKCSVNSTELNFGGGQTIAGVGGILQQLGINAKIWRN